MSETTNFKSGVDEVKTPAGVDFDIMAWAPNNAVSIRGVALDKMREIAQAGDPGAIKDTATGSSAEYQMSSILISCKNPDVKRELAKVYIGWNLSSDGSRSSAVHALAYADVAELNLPEFGLGFINSQYSSALTESNPRDAHSIAATMLYDRDRRRIINVDREVEARLITQWGEKEKESFRLWAEQVVEAAGPERNLEDYDLEYVFDHMRAREDGFATDKPNELAQKIGKLRVERELNSNGVWALRYAVEAKLPDEYIEDLRRKVSPTSREQFSDWFNDLKTRAGKIISKSAEPV